MEMHFATLWESIADAVPDHTAIIQGEQSVAWGAYDDRSARLASALESHGLGHESKLGMYLFNSPEYCETQFASFKIRAVPVNVNYRYLDDELVYLLDNSESEAIVYHTSLSDRIERIRARLPNVTLLIEVDDGPAPDGTTHVDGALAYEDLIGSHEPAARIERDPDDLYMLYTGGTTGMPKGVMYTMGGLTGSFLQSLPPLLGMAPFEDPALVAPAVAEVVAAGSAMVAMPCCPLMHGTGVWLGLMAPHGLGSTVVLLNGRNFDVDELWDESEKHGVTTAVIVGDAFARPMLRTLEESASSGRSRDLSRFGLLVSSGAMFSTEVKKGLFDHLPHLVVLDVLGSSEGGMAVSIATKDTLGDTAKFTLTEEAKVFTDDDREVEPGSGEVGMVATSGNVPSGYFKDDEKSGRTFREIDGVVYSFPGDMATVEADGSINLLGRGSNCINTGGEKVFPEEVEEALKTHPGVADALVFGVPDERFGERINAVVSPSGASDPDATALIEHVRTKLAAYKAPREVVVVPEVPRAPNGKADYAGARALADVDS